MERAILHSDLNCFYASVEMMLDPRLRGKPVAVCGSTEDRHGIVLAKSELAKKSRNKNGNGQLGGTTTLQRPHCCSPSIRPIPQILKTDPSNL